MSAAIERAVVAEVRRRRLVTDTTPDLAFVSVTVRLQDTPDPVRSVEWSDQRIVARRSRLR